MSTRPQQYRLTWPLTPSQMTGMDTMFDTLFRDLRNSHQSILTLSNSVPTTYTVGALLYADSVSTLAPLAGVATGNALISGGLLTAPSWGKIGLTTHISGTLAPANGGTGLTSYTVGDLLYASSTSVLSKLAAVAVGNALISGGSATAPTWGKIGLATHVSGTLADGSLSANVPLLNTANAWSNAGTHSFSGLLSIAKTVSFPNTGGAATSGVATLGVGGTVTVNTTAATATCLIFFQRVSTGGTIGFATTYTVSAGTSFTLLSDNVLDRSVYNWVIIETH